jgi:hypothetical protein
MDPIWAPFMFQVTARLLVFWTVALNCNEFPTNTMLGLGETSTAIAGEIVTAAEADLVGSATETAVIVTEAGLGKVAGAV